MPSGEILFYKSEEPGRGYGYIIPDDSEGDREENVWFGSRSLTKSYSRPERGDRVKYQGAGYRSNRRLSSCRIEAPIEVTRRVRSCTIIIQSTGRSMRRACSP